MQRTFRIFGILALIGAVRMAEEENAAASIPEEQSGPARIHLVPEEFLNRGKVYKLVCSRAADKVEFFSAFRKCLDLGLEFASVESERDSRALDEELAGNSDDVWLSGSDLGKPRSWLWLANNHKVGLWNNYVNWKHDEPDHGHMKHCMSAALKNGKSKWSAEQCDKKFCYVCQKYLT